VREHIDLDVSGLLRRQLTINVAGDLVISLLMRTCSGRLTSAEALGHREFAVAWPYGP
jgi:(2R)-sulfolactate sulfo-lyase subunit beta